MSWVFVGVFSACVVSLCVRVRARATQNNLLAIERVVLFYFLFDYFLFTSLIFLMNNQKKNFDSPLNTFNG